MLLTKIQRPKIFKLKKKKDLLITKQQQKKKKKKQQQKKKHKRIKSWCLRVYFRQFSRWCRQHSEGRGCIPMSVACCNYSIAEVWTTNTCLTTACFANNGTVAGVKSTRRIITAILSTTDDTNNTRRTLYFR